MLCLSQISLHDVRLPLPAPIQTAYGATDYKRLLLLELVDADGTRVWSECAVSDRPEYSPETVDTARIAIEQWLAPRLLDRPLSGPEVVYDLLREGVRGHNAAIAALEMGMWALAAEKQGVSLAKLLGGTRTKVLLSTTIDYTPDANQLVNTASESLRAGYTLLRIKMPPNAANFEAVRALRDAFGPDVKLALDAGGQFTMRNVARFWLLDSLNLTMVEQPLAWDDLSQHATLQEVIKTPICLDESITSLAKVEDMVRFNSGSLINLKPASVGGFTPALAIHDFCVERSIPLWTSANGLSGIGRAYNAAFATCKGLSLPSDLNANGPFLHNDLTLSPWTVDQATLHVPTRKAGLGITVDTAAIERDTSFSQLVKLDHRLAASG